MSAASSGHSLSGDLTPVVSPVASSRPVIMLTSEQAASKVVELRDPTGKLMGVLFRDAGVTIFYSPTELVELQRLAATPEPCRPMREVLDSLKEKMARTPKPQEGA